MRVQRLSPFVLFLLPALSAAFADLTPNSNVPGRRAAFDSDSVSPDFDDYAPVRANPKVAKGTQDAPVDGRDGRPHAGPWVETSAERDRKKAGSVVPSDAPSNPKVAQHLGPDGNPIPYSNDGVMDDPNRTGPKEGTRGTEGGVSEKLKDTYTSEKTPDAPKEAPPLPHSEKPNTPSQDSTDEYSKGPGDSTLGKLEKPADLPEKPHDIPHPKSPAPVSEDPLGFEKPGSSAGATPGAVGSGEPESDPLHSLLFSFTMIIVSEIGDKTFLVAALMAMRHPRLLVFSAAFAALIGMTVLSAVLGHAVPTLIPKSFTKILAAVLFFIFGLKMLKEGREMSPDEGVGEEMKEVEMELEEKEQEQMRMNRRRSSVTPHSLEAGRAGGRRKSRSSANRLPSPPESLSSSSSRDSSPAPGRRLNDVLVGMNNLFSLLLSPAWVQTFAMTFLGEWGDRSQIATIAMAAGQDYWWVTVGAITGHGICTAAAVIGGSAIAGRVSMRVVTLGGATAFLVFGAIYLIEALY
ncbi:GCR1-dependent translation factor 1 [Aspergillus melleus]|uniref:GCR1-dependent translation factor 1 n=1 Tax=Aspergillus melleus TaxID=138277 RepID=UPI001E8E1B7F|nr:GCR1-dependent translation factor 1 [Aspergillus melleus]KAH8426500.1 GCR1-dependent translation factor 1 [Aspergillus melleus]